MNKRERGSAYETRAARFLCDNGIKILERNFRCRSGEIDIIGSEGNTLVFFEVKYRKSNSFGTASEAVDSKKQSVICAVSDFYRVCHRQFESFFVRYDVIAINGEKLSWIKDAFRYVGKGF